MHDIGKRSAVLVNVADCTRLDAYMYGPVTKWRHWGILYIGKTNFAYP